MDDIKIGDTFGRLTVIEYVGIKNHSKYYKCLCNCGKEKEISGTNLRTGRSKSCGCIAVEKMANYNHNIKRKYIDVQIPYEDVRSLYNRYRLIISRCYNQDDKNYKNYGGRGITVCDEWLPENDGERNFILWSVENGYKRELTIDRIDNDSGYSPQNCRWTTYKVQTSNQRHSRAISVCVINLFTSEKFIFPSISKADEFINGHYTGVLKRKMNNKNKSCKYKNFFVEPLDKS